MPKTATVVVVIFSTNCSMTMLKKKSRVLLCICPRGTYDYFAVLSKESVAWSGQNTTPLSASKCSHHLSIMDTDPTQLPRKGADRRLSRVFEFDYRSVPMSDLNPSRIDGKIYDPTG